MNDLIITTNSFTPAKVDFNYQQISDQLEIVLDKYKGLIFTEETVSDCKKTITDLRKGQKSLEDFRKDTKKKLTESVTEFENDCKLLYKKFDEVINPLVEQSDFFETNRKEEKREAIQYLIDRFKNDLQINDKFNKPLQVIESYLNKSKSMKNIQEELEFIANNCKKAQDQEKHDIELITSIVAKTNESDQLMLSDTSYTRLLEFQSVGTVISKIYEDARKMVDAREREKQRIIDAIRKEEQQKENEAIDKQQEMERTKEVEEEANRQKAIELQKLINSTKEEEKEILVTVYEDEIELLPVEIIEEPRTELYEIKGTKAEFEALEEYLNNYVTDWTLISKF